MTKKASDGGSRAGNSTSAHRRAQSKKIGLALIAAGQRSKPKNLGLVEAGQELLRTGKLEVKTPRARVRRQPRFMSGEVQGLRRADRVTVVSIHGSWYRVRTDEGKEGFIHMSRLVTRVVKLRSAETHGGSTRGEGSGGGRA